MGLFPGTETSRGRAQARSGGLMGHFVFKLPDVGEGTAEAEIVAWHVAVGDHIKEDQQLVDVMTDKATVEMTSPVDGVIVSLHGAPGEMATVGAPLVELDVEGAGNTAASASPAKTEGAKASAKPESKKQDKAEERKTSAEVISLSRSVGGVQDEGQTARKATTVPAFATRAAGTKPLA